MSPRKPRSDSKPMQLPDADQQKVFNWCKRMGFEKARLLTIEELGETFSVGSLHGAYGHWVKAESENSIVRAVKGVDAIMAAAGNDLGNLDAALEIKLKEALFAASMSGDTDELKKVADVFIKIQKSEHDDKALQLKLRQYEDKITAAKNELTKAKAEGGMTVEAIEAMEAQLNML